LIKGDPKPLDHVCDELPRHEEPRSECLRNPFTIRLAIFATREPFSIFVKDSGMVAAMMAQLVRRGVALSAQRMPCMDQHTWCAPVGEVCRDVGAGQPAERSPEHDN